MKNLESKTTKQEARQKIYDILPISPMRDRNETADKLTKLLDQYANSLADSRLEKILAINVGENLGMAKLTREQKTAINGFKHYIANKFKESCKLQESIK